MTILHAKRLFPVAGVATSAGATADSRPAADRRSKGKGDVNEHRCSGCLQTEYEEARKQAIRDVEPFRLGIVESPEKFEWRWDLETILLLPLIAVVVAAAGVVMVGMVAWRRLRKGRRT